MRDSITSPSFYDEPEQSVRSSIGGKNRIQTLGKTGAKQYDGQVTSARAHTSRIDNEEILGYRRDILTCSRRVCGSSFDEHKSGDLPLFCLFNRINN